jgi:hypothetical protein
MSVLQELRAVEQQLVARLRELEPLAAEYEELRREAERLKLGYEPTRPQSQSRSDGGALTTAGEQGSRTRRGASGERPTRERRGQARGRGRRRPAVRLADRAAQVLDDVRANPGSTVPEIGKRLNVDYTGLYRVVRKLEHDGAIRKSGAKLEAA